MKSKSLLLDYSNKDNLNFKEINFIEKKNEIKHPLDSIKLGVKDKNLRLIYDKFIYAIEREFGVLISLFTQNILRLSFSAPFILNYTLPNPIETFAKFITQIPTEIIFLDKISEYLYLRNGVLANDTTGFGILLNTELIKPKKYKDNYYIDITYDDFIYFIIENDKIIDYQKPKNLNKYLICNYDYIGEDFSTNSMEHNALMLSFSSNLKITDDLLINITKKFPEINYDLLIKEKENQEITKKSYSVNFNYTSCIYTNQLILTCPINFDISKEDNIKFINLLLDFSLSSILKLLNYDLNNYITKIGKNFYKIINTNNDIYFETVIKCLLISNGINATVHSEYFRTEITKGLDDNFLDKRNFINNLNSCITKIKNENKKFITEIYKKIYE